MYSTHVVDLKQKSKCAAEIMQAYDVALFVVASSASSSRDLHVAFMVINRQVFVLLWDNLQLDILAVVMESV